MKKSFTIVICLLVAVILGVYFFNLEPSSPENVWKDAVYLENTQLGEGGKTINVEVVAEDKSVTFKINTDKETVGEALLEHNLIDGEKGPYGLYVKYVNGIKADYDENQTYWALNKDGKALSTGVDMTPVEDEAHYELVYTK